MRSPDSSDQRSISPTDYSVIVVKKFWLLLLSVVALGCVHQEGPVQFLPEASNLTSYYNPRDPGKKLTYDDYVFYPSGKKDHFVHIDQYVGRLHGAAESADGMSPIDVYVRLDSMGQEIGRSDIFVADTIVIEYGVSAQVLDNRILRLKDSLREGLSWYAANSYKIGDTSYVSILAKVESHPALVQIGTATYQDIYVISYLASGNSLPHNTQAVLPFTPGTKEVDYYAKDIGLVMRVLYDKDGKTILEQQILQGSSS